MFIIPILMLNPYTWLIIAAVIPAVYLLVYVYKKDRLEKEPTGMLVLLVLMGVLATVFAKATESIGIAVLPFFFKAGGTAYNAVLYFIVVGLSEEGFKYLLLKWRTWENPNFNCTFDGVVYAVFVSLGFALWENISYVLSYGLATAVARAVTAVPGHACFGVFMGAFYGAAKRFEIIGDKARSRKHRQFSIWIPVLLHGTYDFCASSDNSALQWIFVAFIAVLFFFSFKIVKKLSERDRYINRY